MIVLINTGGHRIAHVSRDEQSAADHSDTTGFQAAQRVRGAWSGGRRPGGKLGAGRSADVATAVVYCEANFGELDGKTANGLVRHSELYRVLSVIDSTKAGLDTGEVLGEQASGIPICRDLAAAVAHAGDVTPNYFIFGMAPASGMLTARERVLLLEAMDHGMNIVSGLHEFLGDDPEFAAKSAEKNVEIRDVRKPRPKTELRMFSGRIQDVKCPRVAILGTDCAIGKRTTATVLTQALIDQGLKAVLIGTGQTGLMQGARYGVAGFQTSPFAASGRTSRAMAEWLRTRKRCRSSPSLRTPSRRSSVCIWMWSPVETRQTSTGRSEEMTRDA